MAEVSSGTASGVSVIVPVLHESASVAELVGHVRETARRGGVAERVEVIVVDGAPEADTLAALPAAGCIGLKASPGRARQMNAGATAARYGTLLFLHADTRLPDDAFMLLRSARADGARAGAFRLGLDAPGVWFRLIERLACWRNRLVRTPYGDQAHFFEARLFRSMGGYPDQPLMEDVEMMRRLRKTGERVVVLSGKVCTSARRWHTEGVVRCSLRNLCLRVAYACGVPANTLSRWYRVHEEQR